MTTTEFAERHTNPEPSPNAFAEGVKQGIIEERERCAGIAHAHIGSAARKRRARGQQFKFLSPEAGAEIEAEERGEDIAAEMIERAIRASKE